MISRARWLQIGAEKERGRPVPCELRRAKAAELELDLKLERLWGQMGGAGGGLGVWGSDRE